VYQTLRRSILLSVVCHIIPPSYSMPSQYEKIAIMGAVQNSLYMAKMIFLL